MIVSHFCAVILLVRLKPDVVNIRLVKSASKICVKVLHIMNLKWVNRESFALFLLVFWNWPAFVLGGKFDRNLFSLQKRKYMILKKHGSIIYSIQYSKLVREICSVGEVCILLLLLLCTFALSQKWNFW